MPWTSKILRLFRTIPPSPSAADFHGPYNNLLCTLFPVGNDTKFTVFPQYEPTDPEEMESVEIPEKYWFEVRYRDKPVFVMEHRAPQEFKYGTMRDCADSLLRARIEDIQTFGPPLPVIHGASAFGTRLCFYKVMRHEKECIDPPPIELERLRVTGRAPQERWDCDILEEDGAKRFKNLAEEIKQACAALGGASRN